MWEKFGFYLIVLQTIVGGIVCTFMRNTDAEILYKINWPGKIDTELSNNFEEYPIVTAGNEKYTCRIPELKKQEKETEQPYTGPNPIELLAPLFDQKLCSFKLESYWTYEICHGRYVKQYHEEREARGQKIKKQEYFLGTFDKLQRSKLSAEYDEKAKNPEKKYEVPTKKFEGIRMPYVEVKMTDGTVCDLSNKPRTIKLLYVCHQMGKHEIYSLEEVSSCEYEAIILSPFICSHPDYDPRLTDEDEITCIPEDKSPKKPKALAALEAESLKLRHQKVSEEKPQKVVAILRVNKDTQDGEPQLRIELHPADAIEKNGEEYLNSLLDMSSVPSDTNPVQSFLSGKQCLHGGDGWWKYEFCYGKSVVQYHVEKSGNKITIDLGKFDKKKHIDWIEAHPQKRPKPLEQRKQLSHFYSDGSYCDEMKKRRQTEVRLKCVEVSGSPSSVSLFLLEPKTCEYILGVESPLICNILEHADENGLINESAGFDFDSLKSTPVSPKKEEVEDKKRTSDEL
ncbi:endoplasmic reticulum lectin 1 [Microplitis demolitor]|uniref:endoplasmic reticulum lectin 1 n=1 Tax=Microplitis demolitor TaxID=69319 RepID=UPI0004CCC6FE|nr:endoplasmic reticulum lectin 1 [Microplitis demolitor]